MHASKEVLRMSDFDGITTRKGDDGESGLLGGPRMKKSEPVFSALGDVDELSSVIGLAKASIAQLYPAQQNVADLLTSIQSDLVRVGTEIAVPRGMVQKKDGGISAADIDRLETLERRYLKEVEMPESFVFPGASVAGAWVDLARAVCRRAERALVSYISERQVSHLGRCLVYLNRLSDLLYILARWLEQ
ncbi:MAG: cob(I)yrinic acid a,c-diamide adenosyltransferase [Spirochaetales bacterium]|nr:cob(I)yrinic acid a,c-diamide adenosyltransferase [Spirochaetales bacterium]